METLNFTAPSDGILQVSTSMYLDNTDGTAANTAVVYVLYDWDGDPSSASRLAAAITADEVRLPAGEDDTSTLTTAVPVTAGAHTSQLTVGGETGITYDLPNISAVFSPSGSASRAGLEIP